ncbi:MAG: hypothetical protein H7141_07975 [Burkholderiales bacterium]|nr:hypothetical protein [Bacteroidia bacterium]
MNSKEKKIPLFIRLMSRFFALKWKKAVKEASTGKAIKTKQSEDEIFLFI